MRASVLRRSGGTPRIAHDERLGRTMSVADWAQAIALGVERQDGDVLARLFSLHTKSTRRALATIADPSERVVKAVLTRVALPSPWSDMTVSYVRCGALLFGHASKRQAPSEAWHQAFEALQAAARYVQGI